METVFVGLLPYAWDGEQRWYLLGKEACEPNYSDSGLWSGFGGGPEKSDLTPLHGVAREAYEESMGFLGTPDEIYQTISTKPVYQDFGERIVYSLVNFRSKSARAYIAPLLIRYDEFLPDLYIRIYDYIASANPLIGDSICRSTIPKIPGRDGWYEKVEIDWFTHKDILSEADTMRPAFLRSVEKIEQSEVGPLFSRNI